MSNPSLVVVLAEDEHHEMLIRRYLRRCRFKVNEMRIRRSPSSRGSAESWVRKEFVKEVGAYRDRQAHARTALIVIIDADTRTVQYRLSQFDRALTEREEETLGGTEQIARLVPKRNVETWILCLNGRTVDEDTDYKRRTSDWSELIPPAARTLREWTQSASQPPNHCVGSLRTGVQELKRLRF